MVTPSAPATYLLKPKGLDPAKRYTVTFDNTAATETLAGAALMRDGLTIQTPPETCSELVLFAG